MQVLLSKRPTEDDLARDAPYPNIMEMQRHASEQQLPHAFLVNCETVDNSHLNKDLNVDGRDEFAHRLDDSPKRARSKTKKKRGGRSPYKSKESMKSRGSSIKLARSPIRAKGADN